MHDRDEYLSCSGFIFCIIIINFEHHKFAFWLKLLYTVYNKKGEAKWIVMKLFVKPSLPAAFLAGKTNKENPDEWLPLWMHLIDTAGIMGNLIDYWLPESAKDFITESIPKEKLKAVAAFIGLTHDLGKSTAVFQSKICTQLPEIKNKLSEWDFGLANITRFEDGKMTPHALAGYSILLKYGCPKEIGTVIGAHHGKPTDNNVDPETQIEVFYPNYFGIGGDREKQKKQKKVWEGIWKEYLDYALKVSGIGRVEDIPLPSVPCQVILSGLLIMADWIASNTYYFPLIPVDECGSAEVYPARITDAWDKLSLTENWAPLCFAMDHSSFYQRFGFYVNEVQNLMLEAVLSSSRPGVYILEARMGSGKTEAALAAAEVLAARFGAGGLFFALPTQATANGIFGRLESWALEQAENDCAVHGIRLAHGMAEMNDQYSSLFHGTAYLQDEEGAAGLVVHPWFTGKKQALLSDFVIGTVDQLLMAALRQKFVMLRHLGLAGKVVIIDECHAYDAYMNQYLDRALTWLGEYKVPVVLLSATLPEKRRAELIEAYLDGKVSCEVPEWRTNRGYPLLTWTDGNEIKQATVPGKEKNREVMIERCRDEDMEHILSRELQGGGCAGIIVNTVARAQNIAFQLRKALPDCRIIVFHSRFVAMDRAEIEKELQALLGKTSTSEQRDGLIVIGTQVLEQSLDIDFDVMITDLCPMDLLLQRIGRLQRHGWRRRPKELSAAKCYVLGAMQEALEPGAKEVYGEWLLLHTRDLLRKTLVLPEDIPNLVQEAYREREEDKNCSKQYKEAWKEFNKKREAKEKNAEEYRLMGPIHSKYITTMDDMLNTPKDAENGEAAVRDGVSALEVLVMMLRNDGTVHFLPWIDQGEEIPMDRVPDQDICRKIARQRLRLPAMFSYRAREIISQLETNGGFLREWYNSGLLKGELFLLLGEDLKCNLCGANLFYSREFGLQYEKEGNKP